MSVTVSSDSESTFPPRCQILRALRCSPKCCSVHEGPMHTSVTAALGTLQIMAGLFNIGLGPGRIWTHPDDLANLGAAYWLGAVFVIAGVTSVLAGRFNSLYVVGFAVCVNIAGSVSAIVGLVLYVRDVVDAPTADMCNWHGNGRFYDVNCPKVVHFAQRLLTAMNVTMIVLAVLQLCVCISVAALGIEAVVRRKKEEVDVDDQQLQLKEFFLTGPCDATP